MFFSAPGMTKPPDRLFSNDLCCIKPSSEPALRLGLERRSYLSFKTGLKGGVSLNVTASSTPRAPDPPAHSLLFPSAPASGSSGGAHPACLPEKGCWAGPPQGPPRHHAPPRLWQLLGLFCDISLSISHPLWGTWNMFFQGVGKGTRGQCKNARILMA